MNGVLSDRISVRSRFARSANVERDLARPEPLAGYVVTAGSLDVLGRVATTARHGKAGGAWSLTGPYGSGKSSLALLFDAAFGPPTPTREAALRLIAEASPDTAAEIRAAHDRHGTWRTGFHCGLATAGSEPLAFTVLRALQNAWERAPRPTDFPAADLLAGAIRDAQGHERLGTGPAPSSIVQIARAIAQDAPLLLVIDEFGKSLESVRDLYNDPYLLQQIAEAGQGSGLPIFLLTLQHRSFEDYLAESDGSERREWAKVQGRFEDMSFVESAEQIRALIGSVFEARDAAMGHRIARWAATQAKTMRSLGIVELADPDVVASCYPLHPLTAMVLPELCNRYGQHERTLFSFLTSRDPASAASFLAATGVPGRGLPSLGLASVYDYFVGSGMLGALPRHEASRWSEIATRLRDAVGLSVPQIQMAKRIAVLNLVSTTGVVRASHALLSLTDSDADTILGDLQAAGIVTYRDFAREYRVWQGSDVDIGRLIEGARFVLRRSPLVDVMSELDPLPPVVAARHSAENDVLRVFERRYADAAEPVEPLDPFSHYDGEILLIVDAIDVIPRVASGLESAKPVVAAIPRDLASLDVVAREVLAVRKSIQDPLLADDWVARQELAERLAEARAKLEAELHETFRGDACRWVLLTPSGAEHLPVGPGSHAISRAADIAFASTPIIGNEVLNRTQLSSQGTKARRLLIRAMIDRGGDPDLGLTGYGPEVAMYRAFLKRTGIHRPNRERPGLPFGPPRASDSAAHAWRVVKEQFVHAKTRRVNLKSIYAALLSRPIGMKEGVIPVFLTAALLAHPDEIAIYEHGTFTPQLLPEVSERMVRNPHHFDVKHFANTTGPRRHVIDALGKRLRVGPMFRRYRVANVLEIAGHLVSQVRRLDNFTRRTRTISPDALAVRTAVEEAVEPDELLFRQLPECFGLPPVDVDATRYSGEPVYAERLGAAMDELTDRYAQLQEELVAQLLRTAAEKTRLALCGQAAALDGEVLDPAVRAFVNALKGDAGGTAADWISRIATVLSKKAPTEWNDHDLAWFEHHLRAHVGAFRRLMALHADQRARRGRPFHAFRVTITRPDGQEDHRLVDIDETDRRPAESALDNALRGLASRLGSREQAEKALLACFAERLLPQSDHHAPEQAAHKKTGSARHA